MFAHRLRLVAVRQPFRHCRALPCASAASPLGARPVVARACACLCGAGHHRKPPPPSTSRVSLGDCEFFFDICCAVLQSVADCCRVLQVWCCISRGNCELPLSVCCGVLQSVAACCRVLQVCCRGDCELPSLSD